MRPLGRRVLVRRLPTTERIGSIIIPEQARQKPQEGRVEAVGSEVTDIHPGDRVLFGKHNYLDVPGSDLLVIWERDVIGVLE